MFRNPGNCGVFGFSHGVSVSTTYFNRGYYGIMETQIFHHPKI
jgi:hypothetical protein